MIAVSLVLKESLPTLVRCWNSSTQVSLTVYFDLGDHTVSGCLQLLEILEISWNLKTHLEILEISWNLIGPPGNFCLRCRRSTALDSSHKSMDKYSLQKYEIFRHQVCFFQVPDAPKPVFGQGSTPDPCGGAYDAPQIPIRLGRAVPIIWVFPMEAEARQTCPGFFLKSLLESPGNLLD